MITVASSLDLPIKLLFPRPPTSPLEMAERAPLAMLGLGDIVLPGMAIALALKFDLWRHYEAQRVSPKPMIPKQTEQSDEQSKDGHLAPLSRTNTKELLPEYLRATGSWGTRYWCGVFTKRTDHGLLPIMIQGSDFEKPYFWASLIGYVVGMVTTISVMHIFHHAQPALLYLVPSVLASLWGTAIFRGELKWFLEWAEVEDSEDECSKPEMPSNKPE